MGVAEVAKKFDGRNSETDNGPSPPALGVILNVVSTPTFAAARSSADMSDCRRYGGKHK